jgi:hypothetical protein
LRGSAMSATRSTGSPPQAGFVFEVGGLEDVFEPHVDGRADGGDPRRRVVVDLRHVEEVVAEAPAAGCADLGRADGPLFAAGGVGDGVPDDPEQLVGEVRELAGFRFDGGKLGEVGVGHVGLPVRFGEAGSGLVR